MDISVVIALYNEKESLRELVSGIQENLEAASLSYEIIMVNDGSTDGSWEEIQAIAAETNKPGNQIIHGICFRRNYGKSAALYCGFEAAQGDVVFTMDADLQDDPKELPELYRMIKEEGYDLVSGWKKKRLDNKLTKNLPSKIYNATARWVTKTKLHDMNCGLKAYKKEVVKNIEVYGEMHRYIPFLAKEAGFTNIGEKEVTHHKRKFGKSKFGLNRFVNGYLDLMTLWFLQKFGKKPMHLFGVWGTLMFIAGGIIALWIIIRKLVLQHMMQSQINTQGFTDIKLRAVTDQPLFYIALVVIVIGVMLFLTGFIAELISRNSAQRNVYKIKDRF
ncbi:MAG: glycosyltransferase family 2 protein [Bacteroidales bacterium]|jgi:glycosyltransferase involved in cell wall biosynthesis|nr:glycosyltransferase family 2 protein [Bacteroidales bacterium]